MPEKKKKKNNGNNQFSSQVLNYKYVQPKMSQNFISITQLMHAGRDSAMAYGIVVCPSVSNETWPS